MPEKRKRGLIMIIINHTATLVLTSLRAGATIEDIKKKIPTLLLPDAIRMYGPRQQFHFTEHPITGKVSWVKFNGSPDNLKGIKDAFEAHLQEDIPKCVIDELSHPEVFMIQNPEWAKTTYLTHLNQDCAWDHWIRTLVDISKRFDDNFTYVNSGATVDGQTFRKDLGPLDNIYFVTISKIIYEEFGIKLDQEWFEENVHKVMLEAYDEELAENTWKYINLPSEEDVTLPAFVPADSLNYAVEKMAAATALFF